MSKKLVLMGLIVGLYVVMVVFLAPISYGPIQVRFAAGLYTLGAINPATAIPLAIGTFLANLYGGLGILDLVFGPIATVAATLGCYLFRKNKRLMPLAIPLFSAPILAGYLSVLFGLPFWVMFGQIFMGQLIAAYTAGVVIYAIFQRGSIKWGKDNGFLQGK